MIGGRKERRDGDAAAMAGDLTAFLDRGARFEGKLAFDGQVRLNGEFKGEIRAEGTLIVGEGARIDAVISVDTLVVSGTVVGDVVARSRVELHAPARLVGNVTTPVLVVEEGSVFEGSSHMDGVAGQRATPLPSGALAEQGARAEA